MFFQSEIVYFAHYVSREGIHLSRDNVCAIEDFSMLETFTKVCAFCRLEGHYWCFIKGFAHIARPLYNVLGKEVNMGLVQLPTEAQEAVRTLKGKIQSAPMLVFSDFQQTIPLGDGCFQGRVGSSAIPKARCRCHNPVAFGSCSLTPAEKNYHSSKLEFLALKWSVMEHFKEYLVYAPFVVKTDNNPLMYILMTPNLDTTGHGWVGALASFTFILEYQKGVDNRAVDTLSQVPISHDHVTDCCWRVMS